MDLKMQGNQTRVSAVAFTLYRMQSGEIPLLEHNGGLSPEIHLLTRYIASFNDFLTTIVFVIRFFQKEQVNQIEHNKNMCINNFNSSRFLFGFIHSFRFWFLYASFAPSSSRLFFFNL